MTELVEKYRGQFQVGDLVRVRTVPALDAHAEENPEDRKFLMDVPEWHRTHLIYGEVERIDCKRTSAMDLEGALSPFGFKVRVHVDRIHVEKHDMTGKVLYVPYGVKSEDKFHLLDRVTPWDGKTAPPLHDTV